MFNLSVEPEQMAVYPDDLEWWKERVITSEQVIAYFELYECVQGETFDYRKLFRLNPNLYEIFVKQLTIKIADVFEKREEELPKWAVGRSKFCNRVAQVLGIKYISPVHFGEDFLNSVEKDSLFQVECVILSKNLITAYNREELNFSPVVASCLCSEKVHSDCFEIVSLATI